MTLPWTLIQNPCAASGKSARLLPQIEQALRNASIPHQVHLTQHAGHAQVLALAALRAGARHFVAVGGDGTVNEVVNGLLDQDEVPHSEILLTQIPIGTGNDWRRTHGIPHELSKSIALLQNWKVQVQDVGVVEWEKQGQAQRRLFVNIAGIGFEAFVGETANAQKAAGKGGFMGYISALLSSLRKYESQTARFVTDGKPWPELKVFSGAIGICKYNGGGMKQCPDAIIDDGYLDFTLIRHLSKGAVLRNVPRLFNGSFVRHRAVTQTRLRKLEIDGPETLLLEVDGENIGHVPAKIGIMPSALRVAVPR